MPEKRQALEGPPVTQEGGARLLTRAAHPSEYAFYEERQPALTLGAALGAFGLGVIVGWFLARR